jgi:hypothetical protein
MPTECTPKRFEFEAVARRAVVACFDGGDITSNAGALVLGQGLDICNGNQIDDRQRCDKLEC